MKSTFSIAFLGALLCTAPAPAESQAQEQAVRQALSGQQLLVTYREGGVLYGTYYFLNVHFCASGSYLTGGQSRKTTVLDNTQVNPINDRGQWQIVTFNGVVVLRSVSDSGQVGMFPIALLPNGGVTLGDGISVIPQGAARCR